MPSANGIVQPIRSDRTPCLGPLAIMSATDADMKILRRKLNLSDSHKLFLSELHFNRSMVGSPALVGPMMGAPYAVMVLETLRAWGVQTILFMGWCGSISSKLRSGDILFPDSAVIDEGASLHYQQLTGAIVRPHAGLNQVLNELARHHAISYFRGRVWSTDGVFRETPAKIKKYQRRGAIAVEMELSALISAAQYCGIAIAALLIVSDELFTMKWRPGFKNPKFKQARTVVCNFLNEIHRSLDYG